jgi:phospholipid/cholesterol/gamma-HCH transport system substrate-binding protein
MSRNPIETVLGAVVLVVAAMFLVFAYSTAHVRSVKGYPVTAEFLKIGGLERGSDVRISGITVGTVTEETLNPSTYTALVTMSVADNVKLPTDTQASIISNGLLGENYVDLAPGRSTQILPPNGKIENTRNFQSLEDLVGQVIFLATDTGKSSSAPAEGSKEGNKPSAPTPPPLPKEAPE